MNLPRNYSQRNSSWNAPYTFSGKEKDAETGYGYFGARYYDSGLSIWLSVDPMAENTPFATPYAYCINNPIILYDPDGQDWFVNELTGDIYFDEYLTKGDEASVKDGKNIKWLGENDMFGKSAGSVILDNYDLASVWTWGDKETFGRAEFTGENAEKMMKNVGYKKVATQTLKYKLSHINTVGFGSTVSYDSGCSSEFTEKVSYVPNSFKKNGERKIGPSETLQLDPYRSESVSRYQYSYGPTGRNLSRLNRIMGAILGQHVDTGSGSSCTNFDLLQTFRAKYPLK